MLRIPRPGLRVTINSGWSPGTIKEVESTDQQDWIYVKWDDGCEFTGPFTTADLDDCFIADLDGEEVKNASS
jgi:hypothetical protein